MKSRRPVNSDVRLLRVMMTKALLLVLICSTVALNQANPKDELVSFDWKYQETVFATLLVPPGFTEVTENYREGIITYLRYPNGAYIVLHRGMMWKLPFFDEPDYQVTEKKEEINQKQFVTRRVRKGTIKNTSLYWREENSFVRRFNIGFERVPKDQLDLFNKALDSFVDKTRKAQPNTSLDRSAGTSFFNL